MSSEVREIEGFLGTLVLVLFGSKTGERVMEEFLQLLVDISGTFVPNSISFSSSASLLFLLVCIIMIAPSLSYEKLGGNDSWPDILF